MGDDPVQVKFECKELDPCENSRAAHISPHNSGTVIRSEKTSVNANRKLPWVFQRAINQGRASPLTSLKWGSDTPICRCSQKFRRIATKFRCLKFSSGNCSAINYLSNGITILAGNDSLPVKFGPKGTDPNRKDARFTRGALFTRR